MKYYPYSLYMKRKLSYYHKSGMSVFVNQISLCLYNYNHTAGKKKFCLDNIKECYLSVMVY